MSRLFLAGSEPITVHTDAQDRPVAFTWHEHRHRLRRIEQAWEVDADWWSEAGRVWRRYVAVTTLEGRLCVLFYDVERAEWFLEKVYD
jgi:hypothetical protein